MSTDGYVVLSVLLAVVVIAVLALALILVRRRLTATSEGLATLSAALKDVESQHLRPLEPAVKAINAQFEIILGALPGIARKAADRRREEAAMTLWWIGDVVLLVVILPVVVYLLNGVLQAAKSIVPSVDEIAATAAAGSKDLDSAALLVTTDQQVKDTVAGVANYGGSLDAIVDDAEDGR